ncbi:MAG: SsrA-binding protein SmpB [Spirochaetales bacterium]
MSEYGVKLLAKNKRAFHEYTVEDTIECGIELFGTEVKSVKGRKFNFSDSYARIKRGELWLHGLHISPWSHATEFNHEPLRSRKLLVHKAEIKRLKRRATERGFTLVPLDLHLKNGLVKVTLGMVKGKKLHDKRQSIRNKDLKRDQERETAGRY